MTIRHIFIAEDHSFYGRHGKGAADAPMIELAQAECVAGKGIVGDRFFDWKPDYKGQVTFFSWEVHEDICQRFELADLSPSAFRRGIIVEGADLNALIGERFEVQGVGFIGTEEATPCYWMNEAIAEGAEEALKGRGGLRARILRGGTLRPDAVPVGA